jgi:hypothetical protein
VEIQNEMHNTWRFGTRCTWRFGTRCTCLFVSGRRWKSSWNSVSVIPISGWMRDNHLKQSPTVAGGQREVVVWG